MSESGPLVSIIIPTTGNRPALLRRAVESALSGHKANEVEVIVVPNGPEHQWKSAITELSPLQDIHVLPINKPNVCAARNHGLAQARGSLIRFLDDDDFLIPDIARQQYLELSASDAEVSSYAVRIEDEYGNVHSTLTQPMTSDFVDGQLSPLRMQIPLAHVYRKSLIQDIKWNEKYSVSEDILWLLSVSERCQIKWINSDKVVGVWYQHTGPRLSYAHPAHAPNKITAESILNTVECLSRQTCMNDTRKKAAASGLWTCIHRAFYLHPFYWHSVAKQALTLDRDSHPDISLFKLARSSRLNPLLIEWLILPKRLLVYLAHRLYGRLFGWKYIRHL